MTSRERVMTALNHRQPDKVPVDFGGHRSSGIMAIAYNKLKQALGIDRGGIYVYDMVQQLAIVEEPVLEALGVDTVEMGRGFCLDDADWQDWVLPDGTPCKVPAYLNVRRVGDTWFLETDDGQELGVQKPGCLYFEQTYWPYADRDMETQDFGDLEWALGRTIWTAVVHPGAHLSLDAAGLAALRAGAKALYESTDRAVVGLFGGNMFELPQMLYRMDNFLMYMGLYPEKTRELAERLCEVHLANLEKWLGAVGDYVDVVLFGDDLGGQDGPLLSPRMYCDYFQPCHRRLWARARQLADVKVMLHCCGGVRPLLPHLIDAGLDAINPVQVTSAGMDAAALKADFGADLTFWGGGCDTRSVLPKGTPDAVRAHTRAQADILNPGGGYVHQQVHNIMADVPPENVIAMFDALR